jgi:hypothetical protein
MPLRFRRMNVAGLSSAGVKLRDWRWNDSERQDTSTSLKLVNAQYSCTSAPDTEDDDPAKPQLF